MNKNVTFDFSAAVNNQELAVMPANLAQKLLKEWADRLSSSTHEEILNEHIGDLQKTHSMAKVIELSRDFANERELIMNISQRNWDAYAVPTEEPMADGVFKTHHRR